MPDTEEHVNAVALIDKEHTRKDIGYSEKTKVENLSGMPEHRDVEKVYHEVDLHGKEALTQKILDEAKRKMGAKFTDDIRAIPELPTEKKFIGQKNKKLSEIDDTKEPQIFKKRVEGTEKEYRIYVRLNNGEPNSVVVINTVPAEDGKVSFNLAKEKGFFHLTTEKTLDDMRTGWKKGSRTDEGKWILGDISAHEYSTRVVKSRGEKPIDFWKKNDKKRIAGGFMGWGTDKIKLRDREMAGYAVNEWKNSNVTSGVEKIWEKEDTEFQNKRIRAEASRKAREQGIATINNFLENTFGEQMQNYVYSTVGIDAETLKQEPVKKPRTPGRPNPGTSTATRKNYAAGSRRKFSSNQNTI